MRHFGGPSPKSLMRVWVGGWETGLEGAPGQSCNGSQAYDNATEEL